MSQDVARIVERLRRDHPDPAMRAQLYEGDKLADYVRALGVDDPEVVAAVRAAEDGTPGPMK